MSRLPDSPTVGQVKEFLLDVAVSADDRKSKINPSFTKKQMWGVFIDTVTGRDNETPYMKNPAAEKLAVKNINKEFGTL